jgi:hypothetical protein
LGSELPISEVGLSRVHAIEDGLADQVLASHNSLRFRNNVGNATLGNHHNAIVVGKQEVPGADAYAANNNRFAEVLKKPEAHDIGRCRIATPYGKAEPPNKGGVATAPIATT